MNSFLRKIANSWLGGLLLVWPGLLAAQPITFDFTFSGATYGNTALATGSITFSDVSSITNTVGQSFPIGGPEIASLNVTVTGSANAPSNRSFATTDFSFIYFYTPVQLDFGAQLVGQMPVGENTYWGNTATSGMDGDFNLFGSTQDAPSGTWYFQLNTGFNEPMLLTSMTAVPEPATEAALVGASALGLVVYRRRRLKKST